jgi:2-oxo-4-hydroxy-4-carboxy-5-ureidoimidazoline decarboxylase
MMKSLDDLNRMPAGAFNAALAGVFEHSPWVAEAAAGNRPFRDVGALHAAMLGAVRAAGRERQLALIRAHPELAGRESVDGTLTADSGTEQGRLGFTAITRDEFNRMAALNDAYRERFGFPCIIALALHDDRASVMRTFEERLNNETETEIANALEQIGHITRSRLRQMIGA